MKRLDTPPQILLITLANLLNMWLSTISSDNKTILVTKIKARKTTLKHRFMYMDLFVLFAMLSVTI
jgi:hypothetical protein